MDREDAQLVVAALDSRISGDGEALELLHASSFVRLSRTAARVRALAAGWPPAIVAADELEAIAKHGEKALETETAPGQLIIFVDKMRKLLAEPPYQPRNRAERRAQAAANR